MTKEELNKKREELYSEYQKKQEELCREYAEQRNDIKVGDCIQSFCGDCMKVEDINLSINSFYDKATVPMFNYSGHYCNHKGDVPKNAPYKCFCQCSVVKVNGKPYKYNNNR